MHFQDRCTSLCFDTMSLSSLLEIHGSTIKHCNLPSQILGSVKVHLKSATVVNSSCKGS